MILVALPDFHHGKRYIKAFRFCGACRKITQERREVGYVKRAHKNDGFHIHTRSRLAKQLLKTAIEEDDEERDDEPRGSAVGVAEW